MNRRAIHAWQSIAQCGDCPAENTSSNAGSMQTRPLVLSMRGRFNDVPMIVMSAGSNSEGVGNHSGASDYAARARGESELWNSGRLPSIVQHFADLTPNRTALAVHVKAGRAGGKVSVSRRASVWLCGQWRALPASLSASGCLNCLDPQTSAEPASLVQPKRYSAAVGNAPSSAGRCATVSRSAAKKRKRPRTGLSECESALQTNKAITQEISTLGRDHTQWSSAGYSDPACKPRAGPL